MPSRSSFRPWPPTRRGLRAALAAAGVAWAIPGEAWEMAGTKQVTLVTRDRQSIPAGTVTFTPQDGKTGFRFDLDTGQAKDFFLSMREFKCFEGPEVQCYVPYPYPTPRTVTATDLTWLEHALIFFYKRPMDFGAVLRNGLYYELRPTEDGLVGTPQAIDLNEIASPPQDPSVPPFAPGDRNAIEPDARWITSIRIR